MHFRVFLTEPPGEKNEKYLLSIAASLAQQSENPVASEILRIAGLNGCSRSPVVGFRDFTGRGFGGVVQMPGESAPRAVLIGDKDLLIESGLSLSEMIESVLRRWTVENARILVVGWDGIARGVMKFQ